MHQIVKLQIQILKRRKPLQGTKTNDQLIDSSKELVPRRSTRQVKRKLAKDFS